MAWTAPRTWTDGELVTAAIMNAHVRDNLNAGGPHLLVRKTSDETDSTGTPQSDDQLTMSVAANEVWHFKFIFLVVAASTTDFVLRFNAPASANLACLAWGINAVTFTGNNYAATSFPTGTATFATQGTLVDMFLAEGVLVNAGTAGSLTAQWTGGAVAACTVKANSTLWAVKLA